MASDAAQKAPRPKCGAPRATDTSLPWIILEAYQPQNFAKKASTAAKLRVYSFADVFVGGRVGQALCGWEKHEDRLNDFIGKRSAAFCRTYYGEEMNPKMVYAFTTRRLTVCLITTSVTIVQIFVQLSTTPGIALILTMLLTPVTLGERQFNTVVTQSFPRYEHSMMVRMVDHLIEALQNGPQPGLKVPRKYKMYEEPHHWLSLVVNFIQFLSGLLLVLYYVLFVLDMIIGDGDTLYDGSWATAKKEDLLGVFFLPTKEKYEAYENYCELGDLCFRMNSVVILLRVIKDAMNWMDTWLQWNLGPALFGNNEKYFQACCEVIFEACGGDIEKLAYALDEDLDAKRAIANIVKNFCIDDRSVAESGNGNMGGMSFEVAAAEATGAPYLKRFAMTHQELAVLAIMCGCLDAPDTPRGATKEKSLFDRLFGDVEHKIDKQETINPAKHAADAKELLETWSHDIDDKLEHEGPSWRHPSLKHHHTDITGAVADLKHTTRESMGEEQWKAHHQQVLREKRLKREAREQADGTDSGQ